MVICIFLAVALFSILASMVTLCSVKAKGRCFQSRFFGTDSIITICDVEIFCHSSRLNRNVKSTGSLAIFMLLDLAKVLIIWLTILLLFLLISIFCIFL